MIKDFNGEIPGPFEIEASIRFSKPKLAALNTGIHCSQCWGERKAQPGNGRATRVTKERFMQCSMMINAQEDACVIDLMGRSTAFESSAFAGPQPVSKCHHFRSGGWMCREFDARSLLS